MFWLNLIFIISVFFLLFSDLIFLKTLDSLNILTIVTAFGGALSGAWGAYKLQKYKEKEIEKEHRTNSLNKALFIIFRQMNTITMFKIDLDKVKNEHPIIRAFHFDPWKTNPYNDLKFNFEELSFILDTKDLNLLHKLFIVQESFEQAIETINIRSTYYINEVTPEMESKGVNNKKLSIEGLKNSMDINKIDGLVIGTDNMYNHVYSTYKKLNEIEEELFDFAKSQYPNKKFIQFKKYK